MKISNLFIDMLISTLLIISFACQNKPATREQENVKKGEESGTEFALNESYDAVINGARLILSYDVQINSFIGTVENTTDVTLKKVRVEVHLSNGIELGPTTPSDLKPGKKIDIKLTTTSKDFDGWTAHPEIGGGELGHGEVPGEHEREGIEHKGKYKHEQGEEHEHGERH